MSTPVKLGTIKAKGAPNAFGDSLWFRDETDLIWHMTLERSTDAFGVPIRGVRLPPPVNPQGLKTLSTPQPCDDGFVYFQGEGNKLVMMEQRFPHLYTILEGCECYDAPCAPNDGYVYFRNGAGKLARVSISAADFGTVSSYNVSCAFTPAVHVAGNATYVFVADGSSYRLKRIDLDATTPTAVNHGDYTLIEAPVLGIDNKLYIVDNKNVGYELDPVTAAATTIASNVKSAPVTSEIGDDGKVYWREVGDKLYMAARSDTATKTELGITDARPDAPGDGFVYFLGEDDFIYRVSTTT